MVLRSILFILMLLPLTGRAVHNSAYYGQKDFDHFYGSKELLFKTDPYKGKVIFEENVILKEYIDHLISPSLLKHQDFFQGELQSSLSCPQNEMNKMYDYLRFSNRVIALSYIYESIRLQNLTSKKLGKKNICTVDWQKILNKCRPKSKDMKLFVKSAKHIAKYERKSIVDVSVSRKKYTAHWEKSYKIKKFDDISHYRVKLYCEEEYCNKRVNVNTAVKIMDKACDQDGLEFINICSELDNLYGMSEINEAYPLVANSDILTLFNKEGHAQGCLRRFKRQNRPKEVRNKLLKRIFPIVYQQMLKDKERFPQGSIFFAGTLRQFAEKGLDDIYRVEKKVAVKKKVKKKKIVLNTKKEDKVEFVNRIVKKKKKKVKKKKIVKKIKKKGPKKSSFLVAVEMQHQLEMDSVKVNMHKFKYDFLFSIKLRKILDQNLQVYTTRLGLEQMKKHDKLGSSQGPLPLMFLKYLIETKKHQALYNIVNVVGKKFYVNNDIDALAQTSFDYIELQNDELSDNSWQINVVKEPEEDEDEAPPLIQQ